MQILNSDNTNQIEHLKMDTIHLTGELTVCLVWMMSEAINEIKDGSLLTLCNELHIGLRILLWI